jgi:hypothetical protein
MAVLRFRAYYEEDDSVYRDIVIKHTQTFADLHSAVLKHMNLIINTRLLFIAATIAGNAGAK